MLTLDRPRSKAPFTLDLVNARAAALRGAASDANARCAIIAGAEGGLCADIDLAELGAVTPTLIMFRQLLTVPLDQTTPHSHTSKDSNDGHNLPRRRAR
jgi:enoyl-CoA hydratase/carnithine racemase